MCNFDKQGIFSLKMIIFSNRYFYFGPNSAHFSLFLRWYGNWTLLRESNKITKSQGYKANMELIPIIKASLGIFTVLTSITLVISYVVYKIKDRNRVKPYDDIEPYVEKDVAVVKPARVARQAQEKPVNNKFKIVNQHEPVPANFHSDYGLHKIVKPVEQREDVFKKPTRKHSENEVFNIYNLYSNSDARPMHKLKMGEIAMWS